MMTAEDRTAEYENGIGAMLSEVRTAVCEKGYANGIGDDGRG